MFRTVIFIAVTCVCIYGIGIFLTGCDEEKAMTPALPTASSDYTIYFWDGSVANWFYGYHPSTNEIDSFYIPYTVRNNIAVSDDGHLLYIGQEASIIVFDLAVAEVIDEIPYSGDISVSPDDRYVSIVNQNITVLNTTDYSVAYASADRALSGVFSFDGNHYYAVIVDTLSFHTFVRVYDANNGFMTLIEYSLDADIIHAVPSPDESRIYGLFYTGSCTEAFGVYTILTDSMIFWDMISPGQGDLAVSPDGLHVFYSNPGKMLSIGNDCPWPPPAFYHYDVASNQSTEISTTGIVENVPDGFLWIDGLEITPDGKWLVANQITGLGIIMAFDLTTWQYAHFVNLGGENGRQILGLTCQKTH